MSEHHSISVAGVPFAWDMEEADLRLIGVSSITIWLNPSLYALLEPFVAELGVEFFRLLVARSSSVGTLADYQAIMTTLGSTFEEGFAGWATAACAAGWGIFELAAYDPGAGTASVRVVNPFELRMQAAGGASWGCPYVQGKMIGIFSHALGRPCWADEEIHVGGERPEILLRIYPSTRTLEAEANALRRARQQEQNALVRRVEETAAVLERQGAEIEQRDELIRTLSTPLIQVWDGVLVVPLVGDLSSARAEMLNADLLERAVALSARHVVLDLTGLSVVDAGVVERLGATVAALRLIGTECAVVGLSPALARAMISLGVSLGGVRTLRTLADALRDVVGLVRRSPGA